MQKKNIMLIMTDQHRSDYVNYSGNNLVETTNIDRIAESVGFTNCHTVNPVCTPARTALITGKYAHQIGMLSMSGDLSLQYPTFMQALQKNGYFTIGIGKFHFLQTWKWDTPIGMGIDLASIKNKMKQYGFEYIWESSGKQLALRNYCDYCEYLQKKGLLEKYRDWVEAAGDNTEYPDNNQDNANPWPFDEEDYIDVVTAGKIIEQIKNRPKDKPFYLFGSFCSPHRPYDPPERYLDMVDYKEVDDFIPGNGKVLSQEDKKLLFKQRHAAKALIKLVDDQIGRILDVLEFEGILDDTVIVFTSDHGDMLGDHYRIQKSVPWKQSVTVPLAVRHPEFTGRRINNSPVELIDIAATILDIAGIDFKKALSRDWPAFNDIVPCRSLMPIIRGEQERVRDYAFSECEFDEDNTSGNLRKGNWQMIQNEKWKYIRYLGYDEPGKAVEEFYDLEKDPDELINVINNPAYTDVVKWCKDRREFVTDHTPAAQTVWAPLIQPFR